MLSVVPTGQTVYPPYQIGPVSRLADQTSANTALNVVGQGALATQNTVNVGTQVTGTLGTGNAASGLINSNVTPNTLTYTGGATVQSLQPAQAGADVTSANTASGIAGQGNLAIANFYYQSSDPSTGGVMITSGSTWLVPGGAYYIRNGTAWQLIASPTVRDGDTLFASTNTTGSNISNTYTVPSSSIGFVTVTIVGGSGGTGFTSSAANTGGSGSSGSIHFAVSPGDIISYTLGANGVSHTNAAGNAGAGSTFTCSAHSISVSTSGGQGGTNSAEGAGGAVGSGGTTNTAGTLGAGGYSSIAIIAHST
jgi:hypothetical protein